MPSPTLAVLPVDFRYQYEPGPPRHARSAADAGRGELGSSGRLPLCLTAISATRCSRFQGARWRFGYRRRLLARGSQPLYGVIAGERVGSLEGAEDAADAEPGAVWRIGGLVEKPAPEAAPSNLYIVGRYLLSPLVMDLLADQQAGKTARSSSPTPWPVRSTARPCMRSSSTRCRATTPALPLAGWLPTPHGCKATPAADAFWDAIDERGGLMRK